MGQGQAIVAPGEAAPAELRRLAARGGRLEDVCEVERGRKPLGKGSFGTVHAGKLKAGGGAVAVKALDKRKMRDLKVPVSMIASEVGLMRECASEDRFVRLIDFVDTSTSYYLVLEFCDGGSLDGAAKCKDGLGERQVARLTSQLLEGIASLHSKAICHRDVKPENAMLVGGDAASERACVKLGDFGLAVRMQRNALLKEKVGTPAFMSPEMHLLPSKSAGYDEKVDTWAAGAVLVFLLANEYAFVDKHGRLLHQQLLRGDLPLWDADMFSGLFQKVKEVAGIGRKAPTAVARDLVRQLLMPKRHHRLSAARALRHELFREPSAAPAPAASSPSRDASAATAPAASSPSRQFNPVEFTAAHSDAAEPLLVWKDFEEGFTSIEVEFQRLAAAAAGVVDAVGSVEIATEGWEKAPVLDPTDDRLTSCVVCFQASGVFSFLCPRCHHTVCFECLGRLPKPECPHCRHEAHDVTITQQVSRIAAAMSPEAALQASSAALLAAVENPVIGRLGEVDTGISESAIDSNARDLWRSSECHFCQAPSGATNHVCPLCSASVCFGCAKRELAAHPRCPACGDAQHNAAALAEYLAAGEAWASAVDFASMLPQALSRSASGAVERLRLGAVALGGQVAPPPSALLFPGPQGACHGAPKGFARQCGAGGAGGRPAGPGMGPGGGASSACSACGGETSAADVACSGCGAGVCAACASTRLAQDPSCPRCGTEVRDVRALRVQMHAAQVRDSAQTMWDGLLGIGRELLEASAAPSGPAEAAPRVAYAVGDVVEYFGATHQRWILARVLKANEDGTWDLDCKPGVRAASIRRATAATAEGGAGQRLVLAPETAPAVVENARASLASPPSLAPAAQPEPLPESPRSRGRTCESSPLSSAHGSASEAPREPAARRPPSFSGPAAAGAAGAAPGLLAEAGFVAFRNRVTSL